MLRNGVVRASIAQRLCHVAAAKQYRSDVNLRSYDDVLQDVKTKNSFNLLDFALATPLPGDAKIEKVKKTFLYCVDVDFLPNSGGNLISLPAICIDLDSVFGFSFGTLQSR